MNSKQLQYFLITAEQGSIAAASKYLEVAQPAISLQLANLEHELKVKLFSRDFRGVKLTESGEKFAHHAKSIIEKMLTAKADLTNDQTECKGKVIVGFSQSICNVLSIDLMSELESRYPHIELIFRIGPSYKVDKWLAEDKIDIAFCYSQESKNHNVKTLPLLKEQLYLYISQKPQNPLYSELTMHNQIPFSDLQYYDFFIPEKDDALTLLLQNEAQKADIKLKSKKSFGQLMTTLHYVKQGLGLMIIGSSAAFHLESENVVRAITITNPKLTREVFLQVRQTAANQAARQAVYELIRETTAIAHQSHHWRGTLLDKKYARPAPRNFSVVN